MGLTYFKRYRMEFNLRKSRIPPVDLPDNYKLFAWNESLVESHAEAKFRSFRYEIDANVFPCLGDREGCQRLMKEIAHRDGFVQEATWLVAWHPISEALPESCGTIQGIRDSKGRGSIQNIGIAPEHRGQGLGTLLLSHALLGFQRAGLRRATLEVTAQNSGAVRLYQRFGFRTVKTVYKAVEVACA